MKKRILIVDDDPAITASLSLLSKHAGFHSDIADGPENAFRLLGQNSYDLLLQDMNFSRKTDGAEGMAMLRKVKIDFPHIPVILITAWGSVSLAVEGMQAGASDFVTKPFTNEQIIHSINTVLGLARAYAQAKGESPRSRAELDKNFDFSRIIGNDAALLNMLNIMTRISRTDASVLILSESGTGKELIAEAIHYNSERKDAPFVKVNIGGVSASLFDSEMFGHVKGAFTDARHSRAGRFELAEGGTIFLDEIGDIDLDRQVKLLRVLQDRTYEVLGSSKTRTVNARVISATNRDLTRMVEAGEFREDLFYRLNLITLQIPPLRERPDDIVPLTEHFLDKIGKVYKQDRFTISQAAINKLKRLKWPGNIRELKQVIERAVLLSNSPTLDREDIDRALAMQPDDNSGPRLPDVGSMTLEEMERAMIEKSMIQYNNNVIKVAEVLGISRAAVYRRLEKFGIKP
ncbi:MAG: sigma-54 dependent transcriptional regulator [Desulfobacteraceae bacterium]|jgi:DNA-binding NtrC family response regulator